MNRAQRRADWLTAHRQSLRDSSSMTRSHSPDHGSVRLHINELVLHGFPATSRHAIAESTQNSLQSLVTEHGVSAALRSEQAFVDGGSFQLQSDARPKTIGSLLGRAIYGGTK